MVSFKTFATLHDCCAILVVFAESHNLQNMYGGKNQLGKKKSHQKRQKKHFIVFVAAERLGCHLSVIYSLLYLQPTRKVDEANGKQTQKKLN